MNFRSFLNHYLAQTGYQIIKLDALKEPALSRANLIRSADIGLVIDVGASNGQFGEELRKFGYKGQIVSYEPLASAFEKLSQKSKRDAKWVARNMALGDCAGEMSINVAANSFSSSMLDILPSLVKAIPKTKTIGQEKISICRLDDQFAEIAGASRNIYLKMDVQGFERKVLAGASASLKCIDLVQLEMSLAPLYQDEPCFPEMHAYMRELGYNLVSLEPTLLHPGTGEMLQLDGVYKRANGKTE